MTAPIAGSLSAGPGIGRLSTSFGRRLVTITFAVGVVVVLALGSYATLLGVPTSGGVISAPDPTTGSVSTATAKTEPGCTQPTMATSLLIPNYNPATSVTVGDHVDVTFEFDVSVTNVSVAGLNVYTPTVFVTMPMVGGASFPVTFSNHTFTMTGPQWTSLSYNKLVTSNFSFDPARNATLSSQKLGMMADTPYGTLTLEWRWSWNVTFSNGSYVQGPWTIPTSTSHNGVWLPSIFEPAPYVDLVSESPANDFIGSNYTMYLGGDVAGRSFYFELETPAGVVWAEEWVHDNSTTNATFEANFTLLGGHEYLNPGLYIVHIHDSCIALLYSKRVSLSYPPTASIEIFTSPSTCGTVTINGTAYRDGQVATVVPSPNSITFGFTGCSGFVISNFTHQGAIRITGSRIMVVSASGTFTANYRTTAPVIEVSPGQGPVGAGVTVSGTGFSASSPVGLVFDSVPVANCTDGSLTAAGTWESFSCAFAVPSGTSGTSVVATNAGGQTPTGTFRVTKPWIGVDPVKGPMGATVTLSGTGFSVSSPVELSFDNVSVNSCTNGSLTTGGTGAFSCAFAVPSGTSGTSVVATDAGGRTTTLPFAVTKPWIGVNPAKGPVGATVTLSGSGFSVSNPVELSFDNVSVNSCTNGSLTTGGTGAFSCAFAVPSGTSGTSVVATDAGGRTATLPFTVTKPWIGVNPAKGPVGATVTLSGSGFSVSNPVEPSFDNVSVTSCTNGSLTTSRTGSFSCTFTVPSGTSGTSVVVTNADGQAAAATFKVTKPWIGVSSVKGPVGSTVTVSGTGFSVSSTVGLVLDSVPITGCTNGSLTTSGTGSFSCSLTVPSGTSGTSVIATDVGGQFATVAFKVTTP